MLTSRSTASADSDGCCEESDDDVEAKGATDSEVDDEAKGFLQVVGTEWPNRAARLSGAEKMVLWSGFGVFADDAWASATAFAAPLLLAFVGRSPRS